jgi:hypothetical protein
MSVMDRITGKMDRRRFITVITGLIAAPAIRVVLWPTQANGTHSLKGGPRGGVDSCPPAPAGRIKARHQRMAWPAGETRKARCLLRMWSQVWGPDGQNTAQC